MTIGISMRAALAALALSAAASAAPAETLKFAHFVPPAHVITPSIVEPLVERTGPPTTSTFGPNSPAPGRSPSGPASPTS